MTQNLRVAFFEMPNFYYYSVLKEKLAKTLHFLHFETLSLDYEFCRKVNQN